MSQPPPMESQRMWHYQMGAQQLGPVPLSALIPMVHNGTITQSTLVWAEGMAQWAPAGTLPEFAPLFSPVGGATTPGLSEANGKKVAAGLLAILIGTLGIHKFVLGYTNAGIIYILVSLVGGIVTCGAATAVMHIIGIVEGIIYLTKSDQDFYDTYIVNQKPWF